MLGRTGKEKAKVNESFELENPDALLKQEAYDDCLSCRVLGGCCDCSQYPDLVLKYDILICSRLDGIRRPWWIYLLHRHEEPTSATKVD